MRNAEFLLLTRLLVADETARPGATVKRLWRWVLGVYAAVIFFMVLPVLVFAAVLLMARAQGVQPGGMGVMALLVTAIVGPIIWGGLATTLLARVPAPQGLDLERGEAPGLFAELDRLCAEMKVAPFDGVLLTAGCNAQVTEGPRPGRDGRRRYLVLGVPLLQGMAPEEMRAVLAHELAHRGDRRALTRAIDRVMIWLSRAQPMQGALAAGPTHGMFDVPVAWFAPRFRAEALIYRRQQELDADAAGAAVAGREAMAAALARLAVIDPLYAEWGDEVTREAQQMQHPPQDLPERSAKALAAPDPVKAQRWLDRSRREAFAPGAMHPTMSARWAALGVQPITQPLPTPPTSAWDAWLGEARPAVTRKVAVWWAASVEDFWHERRSALHHADALLREPELSADASPTEREQQAWDRAGAMFQLHGKEAARPLVESVLALNPNHEGAVQWMVRERLDEDDASAIELLRKLPPAPDVPALWLDAAALYARAGKPDDELRACEEADAAAERLAELHAQFGPIKPGDVVRPHTLAAGHAALLMERAALLPAVSQVAVVRKELRAKPGEIFHLIAVKTARAKGPERNMCVNELARVLQAARLPGIWRIMPMAGPSAEFTRVVFDVPGACIYDRRHATR